MSSPFTLNPLTVRRWKRRFIVLGLLLLGALVVFIMTWNAFFVYVAPGQHLVVISKNGAPLPPGEVLADEGQKGVQRAVQGEGWHFILPVVYTTEVEPNTTVPAGKVGIVTARGGKDLPPGRVLAEAGERGIQRQVLPPGTYRINTHGLDVELADATDIRPGFVGVRRRLLGKDGQGRFATGPDEKGILREVLQPGLYYINTKEFEVVQAEVGIFQTTFHYYPDAAKSTAITFTSKGGFPISMDCTVEWEVLPEHMPALVADFGNSKAVERTVIDVQAHAISRDKGIEYGVQDFLEGSKREKFQQDFTDELVRVCGEKNVTVHSAFIRNIVIPEEYLSPIRDKQIAKEKELTNQAQEVTRQTEAQVETEERTVLQKVAEVEAETKRIVAAIDRQVENTATRNAAEIEKLKADYAARIASLEAQRTQLTGKAEAEVTRLKETAKNGLYQLKMEVFQNDASAFLRYSLAEQLNPKMVVRLFHSGPGTFWTNMEGKGMSLMLPASAGPTFATPAGTTSK
jgi:regulator of protease activity HflC (stomatin/prohibitin superfamily)